MLLARAGSQLPLAMPRSDARQNLIDSLTCATAFFTPPHVLLQEVAICFGGRLMRGNCTQKACHSFAKLTIWHSDIALKGELCI